MKMNTDSFVSLGHWPSAGSFGVNTDILATNPINLSVVLGVLIFFGNGHFVIHWYIDFDSLLTNNLGPLTWLRPNPFEVQMQQEREKLNLINSTYKILEQLENYKNETIYFEQQRAINQVRQRVFQQALQGALGTLNSSLNNELHLRTISANIGLFGVMKEITD
ncbi:hypothetical protein E1A91_A10G072200v1 [Gossypium mustelinum]|uniref:ATP synthase CF0 subunit I n=1 Tax=Gossypium mustelinum TaxID=34275 RepID=A0A5D2XJ52_GOSMU|nr:hypothetical protein E1A91_A10G072200v1 [Gossypium mustelinum]